MTTLEDRVTRLEAIKEQIERRLTSIENRLNVQIQITIVMWVTTMLAVLATLTAVIVKG